MHLICHQEGRTPKGMSCVEGYAIFASGRTKAGTHGCEIWLSLAIPYAFLQGKPLRFAHDSCKVVHADPTRLLAIIKAVGIEVLVVCAHAPIAKSHHTLLIWWPYTRALIAKHRRDRDLILCIDANASVGSLQSEAIGSHQAERETPSGALFHEALLEHRIVLPATFAHHHQGPTQSPERRHLWF